MPEEIIPPT